MRYAKFDELTEEQQQLVRAAQAVRETAYNPYSGFYVGAAVLTDEGQIVTASNVEEAGIQAVHAEVGAMVRANAMGFRRFKAIAISTRGRDFDTEEAVGPCGSCRQRIYEFSELAERDIEVISANTKADRILITTISRLLPAAFGPRTLGVDVSDY